MILEIVFHAKIFHNKIVNTIWNSQRIGSIAKVDKLRKIFIFVNNSDPCSQVEEPGPTKLNPAY